MIRVRARVGGRAGPRWSLIGVVVASAAAVGTVVATDRGRQWMHRIDAAMLGERLTDTVSQVRGSEDWSAAEALRPGQDYAWLTSAGAPVRIAHALGESGTRTANTLAAARRAYDAGLRLLEVDLVDEGGELRCQHDAGSQGNLVKDGCTFETLLASVPRDAWIVLDIKTGFEAAGRRIVDRVKGTEDAARVVFQLYQPADFSSFNRWQTEAALPGPILTAYRARRSVDHVAGQVGRLGVRAFALPMDRLPALSVRPAGARVLAHPIHDCVAWADAMRHAEGIYTLSSLRCDAVFLGRSTP